MSKFKLYLKETCYTTCEVEAPTLAEAAKIAALSDDEKLINRKIHLMEIEVCKHENLDKKDKTVEAIQKMGLDSKPGMN